MCNIYTNGYQCAMDDGGSEVVINYLLTVPKINAEDKQEARTETVATVIMNKDMAKKLYNSLGKVILKEDK